VRQAGHLLNYTKMHGQKKTTSHAYSLNKFEIHLIKCSCNTTVTRWPIRNETGYKLSELLVN